MHHICHWAIAFDACIPYKYTISGRLIRPSITSFLQRLLKKRNSGCSMSASPLVPKSYRKNNANPLVHATIGKKHSTSDHDFSLARSALCVKVNQVPLKRSLLRLTLEISVEPLTDWLYVSFPCQVLTWLMSRTKSV
jgi:hypothetical protein